VLGCFIGIFLLDSTVLSIVIFIVLWAIAIGVSVYLSLVDFATWFEAVFTSGSRKVVLYMMKLEGAEHQNTWWLGIFNGWISFSLK